MTGTLYLCATPIGNLSDMSPRVIETLRTVDLIAAEDTRNSIKLLNHFQINTPMTSYHEHNKVEKGKALIARLKSGDSIALITDAGTPAISDPGELMVVMCRKEGIPVTSLPGPAALIVALTLSGLPTGRFCFEGFLPADKKDRNRILSELSEETRTIILYEAPHHLIGTLKDIREALGDRKIAICRELTKKFETVMRLTLDSALEYYETNEPRGEYVLVIEGLDPEYIERARQSEYENISIEDHMRIYESRGIDSKTAMKNVAKDRGISKREVYQAIISLKK